MSYHGLIHQLFSSGNRNPPCCWQLVVKHQSQMSGASVMGWNYLRISSQSLPQSHILRVPGTEIRCRSGHPYFLKEDQVCSWGTALGRTVWCLRHTSCPSLPEGAYKDLSKDRTLRMRGSKETNCRLNGWRRRMSTRIGSVPSSVRKKRATMTWEWFGTPWQWSLAVI